MPVRPQRSEGVNGRLYDPAVGRFLNADPYVQDPTYTQSYNRYSYCLNNPLKYADPSGYKEQFRDAGEGSVPDNVSGWEGTESLLGRGGSGGSSMYPGVGKPGSGENGSGIGGVYYDWFSNSYRSTLDGGYLSNSYALGVIEAYGTKLPDNTNLSTISFGHKSGVSGVWYQTTVSVGEQSRIGDVGSADFNATFPVEVIKSFTALNPSGQGGNTDNTGLRAPDFYSLNVTVAIPNPITATVVGWSGNISIDRHGQIFISPLGGSVGKSALVVSASLTANWMLQSTKPTATETYNFLSGHGISVGGGYYGGVNWAISPANSGTKYALGIGFYTPQVGASYNYTPDSFMEIPLILNKH